jgi:peptide/nickel transport system permease protein
MLRFVLRRGIETIPVLFLSSVIVFSLLLLVPGDPVLALLGPAATVDQAAVERLRNELQLDQPVPVRYAAWLGRALQGDLGRSIASRQPVTEALLQRLPATTQLTIYALVIALAIALPLGIAAAVRRNSSLDLFASGVSVVGLAVPNFWLAILLVLLFAVQLRWLPASGYVSFFEDPIGCLRTLLLPAFALGLNAAGVLMRQVRSSMLEVLGEDYVRTARAKGLGERTVVLNHALRNALIPTITVLGVTFGRLMGGSLIVESIFLVPGIGSLLVNAIFTRDFPVVQAGALLLVVIAVLSNLVVDVLYGYLDPRIAE